MGGRYRSRVRSVSGGEAPPGGEKEDGGKCGASEAGRADLAEAGEAGIGRPGEGSESGEGGGATEEQGAAGASLDGAKVSGVSAECELHVDAVIDGGAKEEGKRHEVHEVPRPAGDGHDGEEPEEAETDGEKAEGDFGGASEGEGEGAEQEEKHKGREPAQFIADPMQHAVTEDGPTGEPGMVILELRGEEGMELDGIGGGMDQTEGKRRGVGAADELIEQPAGGGAVGQERHGLVDGLAPDLEDLAGKGGGLVGEAVMGEGLKNERLSIEHGLDERAIGGLMWGIGPEIVGEAISIDPAGLRGFVERVTQLLQPCGDHGIIRSTDEEPERFAGLMHAQFDLFEGGVGGAVAWAKGAGTVIERGCMVEKPEGGDDGKRAGDDPRDELGGCGMGMAEV